MILPDRIRSRKGDIGVKYEQFKPFGYRKDGRPRSYYGLASVEPEAPGIWVNKATRQRTQVSTLLHEYFHVRFPQASERQVRLMERAAMDVVETILEDNGLLAVTRRGK